MIGQQEQAPRADRRDPLVSIVTVNYNGAHLIPDLLRSLRRQTYSRREILVVDNGSTDGSLELLRRDFSDVRVLSCDRNRGFAGGNNAGILASHGEFVALVNNDTVPDPSWLEELVSTAQTDPQIAAVSSKIVFFRPFLPIRFALERITSARDSEGHEPATLAAFLSEDTAFEGCSYRKAIFKNGLDRVSMTDERRVRRIETGATLYLPLQRSDTDASLRLVVSGGDQSPRARLGVEIGAARVATLDLEATLVEHRIDVPVAVVQAESFDVINNAGTTLSSRGDAADRGIFEADRGQYDEPVDVGAFCGAAVLLRRSALEAVGLFDRDFFMYYEDTDLSWRLRSHGYRLRYQPRSRIRHLHASSSVEWSPLFIFHVVRNRILMIAKNARPSILVRACAGELRSILHLARRLWNERRAPSREQVRQDLSVRLRADLSLLKHLPRALLKRIGLIAH
jgi:GT2 family glycosyltransferase